MVYLYFKLKRPPIKIKTHKHTHSCVNTIDNGIDIVKQ